MVSCLHLAEKLLRSYSQVTHPTQNIATSPSRQLPRWRPMSRLGSSNRFSAASSSCTAVVQPLSLSQPSTSQRSVHRSSSSCLAVFQPLQCNLVPAVFQPLQCSLVLVHSGRPTAFLQPAQQRQRSSNRSRMPKPWFCYRLLSYPDNSR